MAKKNEYLTFNELVDKISSYIEDREQLELIIKAYNFAYEKHFGQKRLTGEDYIEHLLNVAEILTDIKADYETICAALLHDTIEDVDVTKEELIEEFSETIANLVDSVTKINSLKVKTENEYMIANQRKILVGLCDDVRVIFIKLADRLHNMRTIWVLPERKQRRKAKETLDILTPIAHRLGIHKIKSELEDLSLRYYKPDIYYDIVEKLNKTKVERDEAVNSMLAKVSELLNEHNIKHEIKGRAKSIYSIYNKLNNGRKFNEIYDLLALRILVDTEQDCYTSLGIIHSKYKPLSKRFKDYIAMPKTNMYQSLHTTVFGVDSFLFEIQIRTYAMDELSEYGIASHWSFKEHGSVKAVQSNMDQKLQFFRSLIELKDEDASDEEFIKSVKEDILQDNIYVFTPKGDVIELPVGSTPIDFAYRVHSEVGNKLVGAIVNNNIVPLDYELHSDDIVKINTNKNSVGPSKEWINIVKTSQAKNKIKSFFSKIDRAEYIEKGEESLLKELRKKKLVQEEFFNRDNIDKILSELKLNELEDLYINIGNGTLIPAQVINIVKNDNISKEEIILNKISKNTVNKIDLKNDIIVKGIDDIKVKLANCCNPIPGDEIIGFITKGQGISVHRNCCHNIDLAEERIINVEWNPDKVKNYPTNLVIHAVEGKNILLDIISKTSNSNITVEKVNTIHSSGNFIYDLTVNVNDTEALTKFMNDIATIPTIISVDRLIK